MLTPKFQGERRKWAWISLPIFLLILPSAATARCAPDRAISDRMYAIAGALYGVDSALLKAIASVESCGSPDAVSSKGAQGLMQLMPATAAEYDVSNPFDPLENLLGAARFLRDLQSGGPAANSLAEVLAAYNAGPLAVARYGGMPPYAETREYVTHVLYEYLQAVHDTPNAPVRRTAMREARKKPSDAHWLAEIEQIRKNRDQQPRVPIAEAH